jgi:ferredoxin--NADP+ reductase
MSAFFEERILSVHHWTDTLFSFRATRDRTMRFRSGEFAMIGIVVNGKPLLRAYSMASGTWEDELEFLSIKVPDGPLTSRLQHMKVGDTLLVGRKSTGTLLLDNLRPGRTLFMLATGTGLAPFLSLVKDPETYARFDRVVVTHTCRFVAELAYRDWFTKELPEHELLGEDVKAKLVYYPTVTREPFDKPGRITDLITDGTLFRDLGREGPFDREADRIMLCGNPELLRDGRAMLLDLGFEEGNSGEPGDFVIEKAFVEK